MGAILIIDATGEACTAAVRVPGRADVILSERIGRGHAERLAPMAAQALEQAGITAKDLSRIAAAVGPGNFAGTRVGVAFARGLALATGADCLGLSNMTILARMADPAGARRVAVVHDAKRGEVVLQHFLRGAAQGPPARMTVAQARAALAEAAAARPLTLAGSAAGLMAGPGLTDSGAHEPCPAAMLDLAEAATPPFAQPAPFYARPPDAKLPGAAA